MTTRRLGVALVGATLAALALVPITANAARSTIRTRSPVVTCDHTFHIVATPKFKGHADFFRGTAAISATDAWAVGVDDTNISGAVRPPLVEHWNGTAWTSMTVPVPADDDGSSYETLEAVAALSSSDVWAVGYYSVGGQPHTLIEHWNGTMWTLFPYPEKQTTFVFAFGVTAISANDAWLAGSSETPYGAPSRTFTAHWNGTKWAVVKSPNKGVSVGASNQLNGISASSSTDVWAVGIGDLLPLVLHWDGTAWSIVKSAKVSGGDLSAVVAILASDALTIGIDFDAPNGAMSELWNGTKWKIKAVPPPYPDEVNLSPQNSGIAAASSTDAWLVGNYQLLLADHWDGRAWTQVTVETPLSGNWGLAGVSVLPDGSTVFAVGLYQPVNQPPQTLSEIYC